MPGRFLGYDASGKELYENDVPVSLRQIGQTALTGVVGSVLPSMPSPQQREADADMATNALPYIGGAVGGVLGAPAGPGAIATAALGGAAGEAAKQLVNTLRGKPVPTGLQAVGDMALTGVEQGGYEATGLAAAKVASKAAPWLMNRALNLTDRLAREFPTMSSDMLARAITVTKGGLSDARNFLFAAKKEADAALTTAHAAGATVPITAATDGLQKTLADVMNSADIDGGLKTLAEVEAEATAGRGADLTPMAADALKRSLQRQSKSLYLSSKMGNGLPNVTVKSRALADMAANLNQSIGDITTQAGAPGYRAANADAQQMMGATRGIVKAMRPGSNLYQAMVRPGVGAVMGGSAGYAKDGWVGASAGAVAGAALTSPAGMSRLAVALANPSVQAALKQAPILAAALASATVASPGQTLDSGADKVVSRADLEAVAKSRGTDVATQEARAKAEGYVIR